MTAATVVGTVVSMTGFAARRGQAGGVSWAWDLRAVNGKGLDLRLRLPEGVEGLEQPLRAELARAVHRGNVSLSLRLTRDVPEPGLRLNPDALRAALAALALAEQAAVEADLRLAPSTAADLLAMRGVMEQTRPEEDSVPLLAALLADLPALIAAFQTSRAVEGRALGAVLAAQVNRIDTLTAMARREAEQRRGQMAASLREALARVMEAAPPADPGRVAQELALLAVRADVTEELDRLGAHAAAARALLAEAVQVGRRLDFLTQELNREANTLCAKAGVPALTRIGLDLKAVIDQMREQVQNVE